MIGKPVGDFIFGDPPHCRKCGSALSKMLLVCECSPIEETTIWWASLKSRVQIELDAVKQIPDYVRTEEDAAIIRSVLEHIRNLMIALEKGELK